MKRELRVFIDADEKSCQQCAHMNLRGFRQLAYCELYVAQLRDEKGRLSGPGKLQRLQECLDAEVKE